MAGPGPGPPGVAAPVPAPGAAPLPLGIESHVCSIAAKFRWGDQIWVLESSGTTVSLVDEQGVVWPCILLPAKMLRAASDRQTASGLLDPKYPLVEMIIGVGNRLGGHNRIWHLVGRGGLHITEGQHFKVHPDHWAVRTNHKETDVAVFKVTLGWLSKRIPGPAGGARQALGGPGGFFDFPVVNPSAVRDINVPVLGPPPASLMAVGFPAGSIGAVGRAHTVNWDALSAQTPTSLLFRRSLTATFLAPKHNWRGVPLTDQQFAPEPGLLKLGWLKRYPEQTFRSANSRLEGAGAKRALKDRAVVPVGEDMLLADSNAGPAASRPGYGWAGCPWLIPTTGIFVGMDQDGVNTNNPTIHFANSLGGAQIQKMASLLGTISRITRGSLVALA